MKRLVFVMMTALVLSSCSTVHKTMREPSVRLELEKDDFKFSPQLSAQAESKKIIGIDFQRLRSKKTGEVQSPSMHISFSSIPVIGNVLVDRTASYALYELMQANPGYDVVFYPQFETTIRKPILGLGFILKGTEVKVTARLAKFAEEEKKE